MSQETIIRLRDVSFVYTLRSLFGKPKAFRALDNINLDVKRGETLGVLGRNGCGKSSLLRLLAGIVSPTLGTIETSGTLTSALLALGLGFNRTLSGRDNALFSAMLQGYSRRSAMALLPSIKEYSELGEFFDQPVKTYSSGMRSKLGFATAIDETLSVGDSAFKKKAEDTMLERINSDQTVVFVSHQAPQVKKICQRAVWLEGGKIRHEGSIEETSALYEDFMSRL